MDSYPKTTIGNSFDIRVVRNSSTFGLFVLDKTGGKLAEEYLDAYEPQTKLGSKRYWSFSSEEEASALQQKIVALDEKMVEPEESFVQIETQSNRFRTPGTVLKNLEGSTLKVFSARAFSLDGPFVKKILASGMFEGRYCRSNWPANEMLIFSFSLYDKVLAYLC